MILGASVRRGAMSVRVASLRLECSIQLEQFGGSTAQGQEERKL